MWNNKLVEWVYDVCSMIAFLLLIAALLVGSILLTTYVAHAHKAPSGMEYDPACCNERDCAHVTRQKQVPGGVIFYTDLHPDGIDFTYEEIANSKRGKAEFNRKNSTDGLVHVCADNLRTGWDFGEKGAPPSLPVGYYVYCLYLPTGV